VRRRVFLLVVFSTHLSVDAVAVFIYFAYNVLLQKWMVNVDKELLSILVCPASKAPLVFDEGNQELVCKASGLAYPIEDGIPVMLESRARILSADEKLNVTSVKRSGKR